VTVALTGAVPPTAARDLSDLVARLHPRRGSTSATTTGPATITVEFTSRSELCAGLRRRPPALSCRTCPRWPNTGGCAAPEPVDWARVTRRERAAVFIPADTSPQEVRDCLHEELAQALGPLNDLYRLSDSVFNDDNFHSVLTGFDMEVLRLTYSPAASGMSEIEVGARLFGTTAGARTAGNAGKLDAEIETALGRKGPLPPRQAAAERALDIALAPGWRDSRTAFSWFAVGKLSAGSNPARALQAFDQAAAIYAACRGARCSWRMSTCSLPQWRWRAACRRGRALADRAVRWCNRHGMRPSGNADADQGRGAGAHGRQCGCGGAALDSAPWRAMASALTSGQGPDAGHRRRGGPRRQAAEGAG
jgi:hypothetical protein